MSRIIAIRALLFALPFAIYGVYFLLSRRAAAQPAHATPWTTLFIAGLSLVAASFIYVGLTEGESTSGVYVPPHVVNGVVVPGHVEKAKTP
jgi:hypothetical protein